MTDAKKTVLENISAVTLPDRFSDRDNEMFQLYQAGWTYSQISSKLAVSKFEIVARIRYIKNELLILNKLERHKFDNNKKSEYNPDVNSIDRIKDHISSWSEEDRSILLDMLVNHTIRQQIDLIKNAPPERAPSDELYSSRQDRQETPPDFIARVYGKWLTGEFTRADLRKLDKQAEMALRNWERKHGRAPINLPTLKERNDEILATAPPLEKPEVVKQYDRRRALIHKRQQKAP